jgi:alpha-galactosidase
MAMLSGYMQRYTGVKTVGLCHSVQSCSKDLLNLLGLEDEVEGRKDFIAGINHMAWLLKITNKDGVDLYPEIKKRVEAKLADPECKDKVRLEYIKHFGYYCTESSEHNAEYNMFYIKSKYPELIERYNIPLDEYPRRCVNQIRDWKELREKIMQPENVVHERSHEYGSRIIEACETGVPYKIYGNVQNTGLITNLPANACVEVPIMVDSNGLNPCVVGDIPDQLAGLNMTHIAVHNMVIKAAVTLEKEYIYMAAYLDPHTRDQLTFDEIKSLCDDLIEAHGEWLPEFH